MICTKCFKDKTLDQYYTKKNDGKHYIRECKDCFQQRIAQTRQDNKRILVEEAGGKCQRCGYNRCLRALTFHHLDRSLKSFNVSSKKICNLNRLRTEAQKCALLCANCHLEHHAGFTPDL